MNSHKWFHTVHDEEERRRWQNPEATLAVIGLKPGFTFIDIGCGEGFFALPAARFVGDRGKVYGIDADGDAVGRLKEKAAKEGLRNVSLTAGEAEETVLCDACADIIFFGIVLHDFRDAAKVLMNAKKMLKPTGRLINLDWKKEPMSLGPPQRIRFSEEEAARRIKAAGFSVEATKEAGPSHYLIVAKIE
ncbi:MAG: class I SAM-dependent methyltransferase, partial [Candidatus Bathyarchaeia archaeon]